MLWVAAFIILVLSFSVFRALPISPIFLVLGVITLLGGALLTFPTSNSRPKEKKSFWVTIGVGTLFVLVGILTDGVHMYDLLS